MRTLKTGKITYKRRNAEQRIMLKKISLQCIPKMLTLRLCFSNVSFEVGYSSHNLTTFIISSKFIFCH